MSEYVFQSLSHRLEELQKYAGPPASFWLELSGTAATAVSARVGAVFVRTTAGTPWQCIGISPNEPVSERQQALQLCPVQTAKLCEEAGGRLNQSSPADPAMQLLAVMTPLPGSDGRIVVAAVRSTFDEERAEGFLDKLTAVSSAAPVFQVQHILKQTRTDVGQFSNVLDLLALINGQEKFQAAVMLLVNELTNRLHADRASIGWECKGYVRIKAISHMEKFEKNMDGVQSLETAMEEAYEQDAEVVWPAPEDSVVVSRDHGRLVEEQTSGYAVSVPLRKEGNPIAVVTLERKSAPFDENELRWLRLCADQIAPRLIILESKSVWFGARAWRGFKKWASSLVGVEHTGAKLLAIAGVFLFAFLLFGRWPHRINGTFELQAAQALVLPTPFDGFIDEVLVEKGDFVEEGTVLLRLETRDLLIEKASALGDLNQALREAEKARAERSLGEMRMAEAMAQQAQARLDRIEDRLSRSTIRAPFSGAVVDGDLLERTGAPVRQGEILFRLAQWDAMRVQAKIDERDIDFIAPGAEVRLIFASRPDDPTPARVLRVDPMSFTDDGANVFVVHCVIEADGDAWWRPGMSGTARVDAGKRAPIWLLTRRTLDYFRLRWGW
jgi:multidrug resistance efflux pump